MFGLVPQSKKYCPLKIVELFIFKMSKQRWIFLLLLVVIALSEDCQIDQTYIDLMDKQLSVFSDGITSNMVSRAVQHVNMIKVTIKNGKISTSKRFYPKMLLLLREIATEIPDLQFAFNDIDQPRVLKGDCKNSPDWKRCACDANFTDFSHGFFIRPCNWLPIYQKLPVLSASSIPECYHDIIIPSRYHIGDHLLMPRIPWEQKQFKAIWRGSNTGGLYGHAWCSKQNFQNNYIHFSKFHRQRLVAICQNRSDCDARFHEYKFCSPPICKEMEQMYGPPSCILMENQAVNKLIIDIDGFTYSRRFPILMATGSVVIKIATFTDIGTIPAKPWVHYIPVKIDLSDFEEKLQWAKENDGQLEQIGKRGKELVYRTIKYKHYRCHLKKVLQKYGSYWVSEEVYQENLRKKNNQ